MKNYLNFETELKNLEEELDKLKDPYNQDGLTEVNTSKINKVEVADSFDDQIKYLLHFTSIISKCKRGRICSYYNNFYRFNNIEYNLDEVKLDKVLKYKKNKDTNDLLKLGEILIDYIDNKNENIADIFNKLYILEGKYGSRFRRTTAISLFWEIVLDKFKDNSNFTKIIKFSQDMFYKNGRMQS